MRHLAYFAGSFVVEAESSGFPSSRDETEEHPASSITATAPIKIRMIIPRPERW